MTVPPEGDQGPRYFFIRRPVLAGVISLIITLTGLLAIRTLPISRYPQITPPAIQVQAVYPGRHRAGRGRGGGGADRGAALGAPGPALLHVGQRERRHDDALDLLRRQRNQDLAAVDVQNAVQLARRSCRRRCARTASRSSRRTPTSSASWRSRRTIRDMTRRI
jgi:hypothetical protein